MLDDVDAFIERWKASGASERGNLQSFVNELCEDVLDVQPPEPAQPEVRENTYVFERAVQRPGDNTRYIDCYKRECFVLEGKQGASDAERTEREELTGERLKRKMGTAKRGTRGWEQAMQSAKRQARRYARALPEDDGWPPFLVVVDVGHCIDLYADFARQGKTYLQFPDPQSYRIHLDDLRDEAARERLRKVWTDPLELDPSRRAARVTRDLAEKLGRVAHTLEAGDENDGGHDPDDVAQFLMRCLFTMFAEDAGLIPERSFTGLLEDYRSDRALLPDALENLWHTMNDGGFAPALKARIRQFNGQLFANAEALPVSKAQLDLLIRAAHADWTDVEPAIFGTLLERALDPRERHRLGAHYTPRAYVERLVQPTIIEPLRQEWEAAQAAAASREASGEQDAAIQEIRNFHERLCKTKVLDPACGSGNFLYVTLEHLKRLEAEVIQTLESYGASAGLDMTGGLRVSPEQLLGMELNPRAARIADVVLWIGYLQWHFRTYGSADRLDEPVLKNYDNIQERDALITYDERKPRTDEDGEPVTRWDRRTMKKHPTTGEMVPDETAREPVYEYAGPEMAEWPEADFIVGNPPFIGDKRMREVLGDGYTEALREAYYRRVPQSVDFVMFWWYKAALAVRGSLDEYDNAAERFGFVTTNSVTQTFNRRVVERQMGYKNAVSLAFAIPDHPWVTSREGADVRIAMTVGTADMEAPGTLQTVLREDEADGLHRTVELTEERGAILPDLTIGPDVAGTEALEANDEISFRGMTLVGSGFVLEKEEAEELRVEVSNATNHVRPFLRGRDIVQISSDDYVIDLYELNAEEARNQFPELYQIVRDRVKPFRDENNRASYRENWWVFGEPRSSLREAASDLKRYIATPRTSKHRVFTFLPIETVVPSEVVVFATDDPFHLGILSSRTHVAWALAAGGNLGVGNDPRYNATQCFDPFPFPAASASQKERIREIAESLDEHRKSRLDAHDDLTMTVLYNVLEKERAGEELDDTERQIHEQGLVGILRELHDDLDAAVADAYGWPAGLDEEEILYRLVALNKERRAEEEQGRVRYLRPAYQAPEETQTALEIETPVASTGGDGAPVERIEWGGLSLAERTQAIQQIVAASTDPLTAEDVAARFRHARRTAVSDILETLAALGQAEETQGGAFAG